MLLGMVAVSPGEVDGSLEDVRRTAILNPVGGEHPVRTHMPETNEVVTDGDTEGGLNARAVSQYRLPDSPPSSNHVHLDKLEGVDMINRQVSSAGYAPSREAVGQWGHERLHMSVGMEPPVSDEKRFGNVYFAANDRPIGGMTNQLNPIVDDEAGKAAVLAAAQQRTAAAYSAATGPIDWSAIL